MEVDITFWSTLTDGINDIKLARDIANVSVRVWHAGLYKLKGYGI